MAKKHQRFKKPAMLQTLVNKLISSIFIFSNHNNNFLLNISNSYKLFKYLITFSINSLFFFLSLLLAPLSSSYPPSDTTSFHNKKPTREFPVTQVSSKGDSGIARALAQVLSIMNEVSVSSRKYETVRCLAEKMIDENLEDGCKALREVNGVALMGAFVRTLSQLEAAMLELHEGSRVKEWGGSLDCQVSRVLKAVRVLQMGRKFGFCGSGSETVEEARGGLTVGLTAEKLAAELLWLAQKLVACGGAEEAVLKWGSTSNLASLALFVEPRLQGLLVKVSTFLLKQAKEMKGESEEIQLGRMKMLMTWLPFLCRASNGSEAPVLSCTEKKEVERVLEEIIEMLRHEDQQEKVLSLWLHHFTSCPSSDWPNLQPCYARWCNTSRKLLTLQ